MMGWGTGRPEEIVLCISQCVVNVKVLSGNSCYSSLYAALPTKKKVNPRVAPQGVTRGYPKAAASPLLPVFLRQVGDLFVVGLLILAADEFRCSCWWSPKFGAWCHLVSKADSMRLPAPLSWARVALFFGEAWSFVFLSVPWDMS
jgi:hypothetical protein